MIVAGNRVLLSRLFTPSSSTACPLFARLLSSSSNDDERSALMAHSMLGPSSIVSPFADPSRTRLKTAEIRISSNESKKPSSHLEFSSATSALPGTFASPPKITPDAVSPESVKPSSPFKSDAEVVQEVQESLAAARSLPTRSLYRRLIEGLGLSIDRNASEEEQKRQRTTRNTKVGGFFVFGSAAIGFVCFCFYYGLQYVVEPSREKLLPEPLPPGYLQPKYTICIEMKNILVVPEWTYKTGYRFKQRPALEYFLDVIGYPNFEVVIYTSESSMTAAPVVDTMDPKQRIMYRLYKDCTKFFNGHHVKDLNRLNRDLSKVILIDFDPKSFQLNPENVLRVPKWEGEMNDTSLVDLAELLKTIHLSDVEDVRPVLEYYSSFDDPAKEFRRRALHLANQEAASKEATESNNQSLLKRYSGRLFGFRRHATT